MNIAFQKNPNKIFSKLICWWTKSPYFHTELFFSNGVSFSAQPLQKTKFHSTDYNNKDWDFINIPMSKEQEEILYKWCISESGCNYDYVGIFFCQILNWSFENPWWWFCSEICLAGIQKIYPMNKNPYEFSPGKLYELLKGYNYE